MASLKKQDSRSVYKEVVIDEIIQETPGIKTFLFNENISASPGQFIMFWIPGLNEKPFSLSYRNGITVKLVKEFTAEMSKMEEGDVTYYRGPLGNGFPLDKLTTNTELNLFGGGTGIAPLAFSAEEAESKVKTVNSFIGAKSEAELLFEDRLKKCSNLRCSVECAPNEKTAYKIGMVTDFLDVNEILQWFSSDSYFYLCGPEKMMVNLAKKLTENNINPIKPEKIQLSLERWMKCGYGICGSCKVDYLSVCRNGPVFSYDVLKGLSDFGKYKRNKFGERVPI